MSSTPAALHGRARRSRRGSVLAVALLALAALVLGGRLRGGPSATVAQALPRDPALLDQRALEQAVGVRVVRVSVTGGGGLIDVRYRVVDEQKALAIHEGDPPALVDERTGLTLDDQWMGHLMHPTPHLGRTYYLLLLNPGRQLRPGSGVVVRLGDATLPHVLVR